MYTSHTSPPFDRRQARVVAAVLEDLIEDCGPRTSLGMILRRARGEVLGLLSSEEQLLSRNESLSG